MKRAWWNFRYAFIFWTNGSRLPFRRALQCAESSTDSFEEGMTPMEAVKSELEYWTE